MGVADVQVARVGGQARLREPAVRGAQLPGQDQGKVVERHVTSVDVLPTIASVLGVRVRWKLDGHSALSSGPGSGTVRVGKFSSSFEAAQALRQQARQRKLALFGSGSWGPQLSGTGRYRGLVGQPLGSLQITGSIAVRSFPKGSPLIPSPLAGPISGVHPGDALAFALNGQVAAVSQAYRERGGSGPRFSALAPDSAFRTGRNSVRVFLVTGSPSAPQLRELRVALSG